MNKIFVCSFLLLIMVFTGCREQYLPDVISGSEQYLVVEGVLNPGPGSTSIRLTRTTKIDRTSNILGVTNARVTVEGRDGIATVLAHSGNGLYTYPNLNLTLGQEYRVHIYTTDGKEYVSAYVVAKATPAIDSITWEQNDAGVSLAVNTHDDANNTRYYRWEYDETWEIRTYYYSRYIYENSRVRARSLPAEDVSICWRHNSSKNVLISSTVKLQSDVVSQQLINTITNGDDRLSVRYSILVRQYALDKAGYEFYDLIKKNTENIGTIFDPQPSEVRGNITCINDPGELVIGYIYSATPQEKRIFISASEVPNWRYDQYCEQLKVTPDSVIFYFDGGAYMPYDAVVVPSTGQVDYYFGSLNKCVDCQTRGGVLTRPTFW